MIQLTDKNIRKKILFSGIKLSDEKKIFVLRFFTLKNFRTKSE